MCRLNVNNVRQISRDVSAFGLQGLRHWNAAQKFKEAQESGQGGVVRGPVEGVGSQQWVHSSLSIGIYMGYWSHR